MNCEDAQRNFAGYLMSDLDEDIQLKLNTHTSRCEDCRRELEEMNEIWTRLGVLPEELPSRNLKNRFYAMLETHMEEYGKEKHRLQIVPGIKRFFERINPRRSLMQWAATLALVILGWAILALILSPQSDAQQLAALRQEMDNLRHTVALTLLKQPSASDRLMGVSWIRRMTRPDSQTFGQLLDILNHDSNVNVRLAGLDVLWKYRDKREIQKELIRSLNFQDSALVQLALIDVLVDTDNGEAREAIRKFITGKRLNPAVTRHASKSLDLRTRI